MKQTASEWLESRISILIPEDIGSQLMFKSNIAKAKEMEKQQIIDANKHGFTEGTCFGATTIYKFQSSKEYYEETFNK